MKKGLIYLLLPLLVAACGSSKKLPTQTDLMRQLLESNSALSQQFTGFLLVDPTAGKTLYSWNEDKYFTPASNIKLLTFFTSLKVLGDSLPVLGYEVLGDSLLFWGTGNPMFLHPDFPPDTTVISFLRKQNKQLIWQHRNMESKSLGPGWAWDDYTYGYQAERSPFPIFGNVVHFFKENQTSAFDVSPRYFQPTWEIDPRVNGINRGMDDNVFQVNPRILERKEVDRKVPFHTAPGTVLALLKDTLQRPVSFWHTTFYVDKKSKRLSTPLPDTLYRKLLQDSDNFIAEQLLLCASNVLFDTLDTERVIDFAIDSLMQGIPDKPIWVDGSGLSRYNMVTPRSMIWLLQRLYESIPKSRLLSILPAGGQSGTLQNLYESDRGPYVFGKTGTLRHNHNLSGFIRTDSGKLLMVCYMNNHFPSASRVVKKEMEQIFQLIKKGY